MKTRNDMGEDRLRVVCMLKSDMFSVINYFLRFEMSAFIGSLSNRISYSIRDSFNK